MKKLLMLLSSLALVASLTACGSKEETKGSQQEEMKYSEYLNEDNPKVEINFKDFGTIELELFPSVAPNTVANFLSLARDGFYDGLTMHRIIKDFMIQGGDPKGDGTGGTEEKIEGEFASNGINNPLSHYRGVISMARSQDPNSASCQFFIVHKDSKHLDGEYASFGGVTSGFEVLDAIASVKTSASDKPKDDVIIESVKILKDQDPIVDPVYYNPDKTYSKEYKDVYKHSSTNPVATVLLEDGSKMEIELFPSENQNAVDEFINLVNNKELDGQKLQDLNGSISGLQPKSPLNYYVKNNENSLLAYQGAVGFQRQATNLEVCKTFNSILLINSHATPGAEMLATYFGFITSGLDNFLNNLNGTIKEATVELNGYTPSVVEKLSAEFKPASKDLERKVIEVSLTNDKSFEVELYPTVVPSSVEVILNNDFNTELVQVMPGAALMFDIIKLDEKHSAESVLNGFPNNLASDKYSVMLFQQYLEDDKVGLVINTKDNPQFEGLYTVVGKVISGTEVIDELSKLETNPATGMLSTKVSIKDINVK